MRWVSAPPNAASIVVGAVAVAVTRRSSRTLRAPCAWTGPARALGPGPAGAVSSHGARHAAPRGLATGPFPTGRSERHTGGDRGCRTHSRQALL